MIEMRIIGVQEVLPSSTPVVLLREEKGERLLPIFIGVSEATAIGLVLAGQEPPRPMTHDLIAVLLDAFTIEVEKVHVTELRDRTFFAELHLRGPSGSQVLSCRPSDAIALAIRTDSPILASEEVLEEAGYMAPLDDSGQAVPAAEAQVEEFKEFLDSVNPEDFAGG
ncbi:MAG: bifunctional nuclease family protein [Acidimicrobiia bacterium]|nr:bifunctional nuclease family protein [Actinomycetota bacterium]MBL6923775.1 bifunctional nuclease family protein [Acidimicrobiia bacterium]MBL6926985.1 bifunctional nuclease family protein [Acidimicrobiia bacterium]